MEEPRKEGLFSKDNGKGIKETVPKYGVLYLRRMRGGKNAMQGKKKNDKEKNPGRKRGGRGSAV